MDKIKTRENRKEIKALDKSALISSRMKDVYIRSKKQVDPSSEEDKKSPEEYAESTAQDSVQSAESVASDLMPRHSHRSMRRDPEQTTAYTHEADDASKTSSTERSNASARKRAAGQQYKHSTEEFGSYEDPTAPVEQGGAQNTEFLTSDSTAHSHYRSPFRGAEQETFGAREAAGVSGTSSTERWKAAVKKQTAEQQRRCLTEKFFAYEDTVPPSASHPRDADPAILSASHFDMDMAATETDAPRLRLKTDSRSIKRHEKNDAVKASSRQIRQEKQVVKTIRQTSDTAVKTEQASAAMKKAAEREARKTKARVEAAQRTARATVEGVKAAAEATVRAVKAIIEGAKKLGAALAAGGSVALVVIVIICLIGLLVGSSYGVLFSGEVDGEQTLQTAIQEINGEWQDKLNTAKSSCDYEQIRFSGSRALWTDVIAIYAVKVATDEESGQEVVTMDDGKKVLLREIFWDMNSLDWHTEIETETVTETVVISHEGETDEDGNPIPDETKVVEKIIEHVYLCIDVSGKSAEEMQDEYHFTRNQRKQLAELLEVIDELNLFAFDIAEITSADAVAVWNNLPSNLSEQRREVVYYALTLAGGKVHYFWGGKSLCLGNDPRWGQSMLVWAAGSSTTGTYRPYGMDCSGFVDWVFYNASGGSYVIGQGGGCIAQHNNCYSISWGSAIPGDLVFYPGDSHIGIFVGRDSYGNPLICHCASGGQNGVYVTGQVGFTSIARPYYFGD